ncbi:MAG: hypothetical protein ACM31D_06005 [Bacteroidota bacterium]
MLGKISGADVLLANIRARIAQAQPNKSAQTADDQTPASEALQRSQQALNTLKQANSSQAQQRKANAKAKVDRLKKELENLRLMGGDPKAIARRAAQISRELASAAKEYAASKGQAGLGLPAGTEAGGDSAVTAAGAEDGQAAEQGGEAAGEEAVGEAGAAGEAAEAKAEAAKAEAAASEAAATAKAAPDEAAARDAKTAHFREDAAKIAQKGAERKEDTEFAAELRRLHALAKSIFAQQRRRAEQEGGSDAELDRLKKQIDDAGADIQGTFTDVGMATVSVPLALQV